MMSVFQFETSMPFPLARVTTEVHHTEVKKPSGISYILLVIINESKNKLMKLKDLLIQFGVSRDLHPIFADEIKNLINELEIIECIPYQYNTQHFDEYEIGNFKFTTKGKKIFKEELIPSKNTVEDKEQYWFDPARNRLMTSIPNGWLIGNIDRSELPNKFGEKFIFKDDIALEEYLNSQKGNGICVKKEEIITKINILEQSFFFTTYPIKFELNSVENNITFSFKESSLKAFFDNNYDSELKGNCLAVKRKFKFKSTCHKVQKINFENKIDIHYPEKYEQFLNKQYDITITKGNYITNQRNNAFVSSESMQQLSNLYETLHFSRNKAIALAPLEISFNDNVGKGIVELPFLIEITLSNQEIKKALTTLIESFNEYRMDNIKNLYKVYSYQDDLLALQKAYESFLSDDIEHNISVLKSIKDLVNIKNIEGWFKQKVIEAFNQYYDVISLDAIDYQLAFGNWMIKYLNISDKVMIQKAVDSNQDVSKIEIYDFLENADFKSKDILSICDILPIFISYILGRNNLKSESRLFLKIQALKESFSELKEISGLHRFDKFSIREDIDKKKYRETYLGFKQKLNEISFTSSNKSQEIKEFEEYLSNFDYFYSLFNEEHSASNNPKNIKKKHILKKIKSNDYFSAIVYLSVKLEWILTNRFKFRGSLVEMINQLDDTVFSNGEKDSLHLLRKERNNLIHSNDRLINIDKHQLNEIVEIIFKEEMVQ